MQLTACEPVWQVVDGLIDSLFNNKQPQLTTSKYST